jgi:hypothetical protein
MNNGEIQIRPIVPPPDGKPPTKQLHSNIPDIFKGQLILIVAPIRNGKSVLWNNMILSPEWYDGCFEDSQVTIISNTIANDKSSRFSYKRFGGHELYDDSIIENFVKKQKERIKNKMETGFALLLDDLQGDLNPHGRKGGAALRLATRFRHYVNAGEPALFLISNQKWNGLATVLRANATGVMLSGGIKSKKELETIREDLADSIGGGAKFDEMFARAQEKPYSWLYIRLDSTPPEVYLNFNERLF